MKNSLVLLLLVTILGLACEAPKKNAIAVTDNSKLHKQLDEYFSALTKLKKFNGAVLVHKDEEIIIHKAFNFSADKNSSLQANKDSQFDIHSISKLMAKASIVNLEQEGLINRTDKVSKYIPDFPKGDQISIEHLLLNQSGLPRGFTDKPHNLIDKSPSEVVELIKKENLLFSPGTETLYSNLGYQLIYFIISKITNRSFVQYCSDSIFDPLDMPDSGAHFFYDKSNLTRPVKNNTEEDGEIVHVPNYEGTSKSQSRVYSTLEDLLKFILVMKKEPYKAKLTNQGGNIGWSGGGEGILSHAEANLKSGYELVFFSNYDEISFGRILQDVDRIMTGKKYIIPAEINRTAIKPNMKLAQKYVGKYDMAEFNHYEFEIRIEKDSVAFYQDGEFGGMLNCESDSTYYGDPKDEDYFIFRKNDKDDYNMIFMHKGIEILGIKK